MTQVPPAIGATSAGLRYQVRWFWFHALCMLYDNHIAKVVVEHREVDAVDDIVVYYVPPGINEGGTQIEVDFMQVKFHVAQSGVVNEDALIDPKWTGTKECLLKRFADAWRDIRMTHPTARLSLKTNWLWDSASKLGSHFRDGGHLDEKFFAASETSEIGKIREKLRDATGLDAAEFDAFARALRFSTSAVSQVDAELWVRDRCRLAGLTPADPALDWNPYDDLGKRLIENGRTEHTPDTMRKLVQDQRLVASGPSPFSSTLAVRSFRRFAHAPAAEGACLVDLTDLFDGRRAIDGGCWAGAIKERLDRAVPAIEQLVRPVQVALDAHLSIAWYVGSLLNAKSGVPVVLRQNVQGKGTELWEVGAARLPASAPQWSSTLEKCRDDAPDLAVVLSVTHDAVEDVSRFVSNSLDTVGAILHLKLEGVGPAIVDGAHARWLADELVRRVRQQVVGAPPGRVHLFAAAPASLMFLIGRGAGALGPTTVYEFSFGAAERTYYAGMAT